MCISYHSVLNRAVIIIALAEQNTQWFLVAKIACYVNCSEPILICPFDNSSTFEQCTTGCLLLDREERKI